MKLKKIIVALLAVLAVLASLPVAASERTLTFESAVQINDRQMVLKFSEPVAINMHGNNRGPYIVIRLINSSGGSTRFNLEKHLLHPSYNKVLQWTGNLQYLDNKHDRLLWTITGNTLGINTITDITDYAGDLADYSDRRVAIVIEEVPFDETGVTANNAIDNITTEDGEVYLQPTLPAGWERVVAPFEVNFSYPDDLSRVEPIGQKADVQFDQPLISHGEYEEPAEEEVTVIRVKKNNTVIDAAIWGGCLLVGVAIVVIAIVIGKKRRA